MEYSHLVLIKRILNLQYTLLQNIDQKTMQYFHVAVLNLLK